MPFGTIATLLLLAQGWRMASPNDLRIRFDRLYTWAINCWISAAVVILLTFAAAALRLDDYPILPDGLRSMATAGYLDVPPDVSQVIRRLSDVSQQHVPAYFLTLFGWGNISGWEPLALRALSIYFGVISPGADLPLDTRFCFAGDRLFCDCHAGFVVVLQPVVSSDPHVYHDSRDRACAALDLLADRHKPYA